MTNIGIVIWENAEPLDFTGPFEVFNNTSKFVEDEEINVYIVAENKELVNAQGLQIMPHHNFDTVPSLDMILFPGGGVGSAIKQTNVSEWLIDRHQDAKQLLSVCTGVFILASADLLQGATVTTHIGSIERLQELEEEYGHTVKPEHRYHDNGKIVTSAGISAGIDMALHIVAKHWGMKLAEKVANYMEYRWNKEDQYR